MSYVFPTYEFGAAQEMDALIYGTPHPNTLDYLRNQYNSFSDTLMAPARAFLEQGKAIFERFNGSEAMRFARNVIQSVRGTTDIKIEGVQTLFELNQFQNAGIEMQRWVMANPVIRELYHEQRCDGYSQFYKDMEPDAIGEQHYDYRMVNDGVMKIEEDDWKIVHYMEQLKEGDRELLPEMKADILYTWSNLEFLIALGKDPTSDDPDATL